MPNLDGSGPLGRGKMTGRKIGKCNNSSNKDEQKNNKEEIKDDSK